MPEGDKKKKPFFSSKRGAGAADDKKNFFHAGGGEAPQVQRSVTLQVQRLATSEVDEGVGTNEERLARNKGDKFRQEHSADGKGGGRTMPMTEKGVIQRDLAVTADTTVGEPALTIVEIRRAIEFNNQHYTRPSILLMQDIVGGPKDGVMSETTVRLIALYQAQNYLRADGMAGPDTFNLLTGELAAENVSADTCLNYFTVGVTPPQLQVLRPGRVGIRGHFNVEARFSPHCDCSRFQYRQFITGDLTRNGVNRNNWINHAPGGGLPGMGNWIEDGDNTLPANGPYGHRNLQPNLGGAIDQYVDADGRTLNMVNGCIYQNTDFAGLDDGPGVAGDNYVLDIRFMGQVIKDGRVIERIFWSIRGNFNVP